MSRFDFFSTDEFDDKYADPGSQLDAERDWFENNVWGEINDSAETYTWPSIGIPVSSNTLENRTRAADDWLTRNFQSWNKTDAAIVMDAFGSSAYVGYAIDTCGAGGSVNKTCIVDTDSTATGGYDDTNPGYRRYIGHEAGHLFCADHEDRAVKNTDDVTYMYDDSNVADECYVQGSTNSCVKEFSYCAESEINNKSNNI